MKKSTDSKVKSIASGAAGVAFFFAAQNAWALPHTHDGFYLQIDAGLGYLSSTAEAGGTKLTYKGLTLPTSLLLGGTVGPVVIGGGFITDYAASPSASINGGASQQLNDVSLYLIAMGVFADIYPDKSSGLHFQPFLGMGGLQATYQGYTGNSATGMVLALGGGYDWWVADEWSIGIMGRLTYAPLSLNGVGYSTFSPALLATFTYH